MREIYAEHSMQINMLVKYKKMQKKKKTVKVIIESGLMWTSQTKSNLNDNTVYNFQFHIVCGLRKHFTVTLSIYRMFA